MNDSSNNKPNAYAAYMIVALVGALACVFIPQIALTKLSQISDSAMWSIAAMTLAPAALGIGVSYFVHQTAVASRAATLPTPPVAAQEGYFREGPPSGSRTS